MAEGVCEILLARVGNCSNYQSPILSHVMKIQCVHVLIQVGDVRRAEA